MHDQSIYHSYILVLGWLLIVVATWILWRMIEDRMVQRRYHFPALVPGFPVIGNTFQMPKTGQGPYLQTLGEKYGEM